MGAITLATIVDSLDANLNEMYQDGLQSWPEEFSKVVKVEKTDLPVVKDSYQSGFAAMPEKPEGVAATYDTILPGIPKTYVVKTYALGYEITEEAIEDNQRTSETFNKFPEALSRSGSETIEICVGSIFNNAFDATNYPGPDGVALCSVSHPTLGAGLQANTPSTQVDLSAASLISALTAIDGLVDERGLKRISKAALLIVPTASWVIAEEILGSEYKPLMIIKRHRGVIAS